MHAYLFISRNSKDIEAEIETRKEWLKYKKIYFEIIKIADVNKLSTFTQFTQSTKQLLILQNIDKASSETQSALLKTIEEPQKNNVFVLTGTNAQSILATIISRSEVVEINKNSDLVKESDGDIYKFLDMSKSEKLVYIKNVRSREDAVEFLSKLATEMRMKLLQNMINPKAMEVVLDTISNINRNGNVQIQMTRMILQG